MAQEVGIEQENTIPLGQQMRALLTNKYFVILTILTTVGGIADNFKGGNVQYFYIKFLLDGVDNPFMFTLYQIITGVPLGLGAIIAYPLAKKFGIRNCAIAGYSLVLVGQCVGLDVPGHTAYGSGGRLFAPVRHDSQCLYRGHADVLRV